MSDEIRKHYKDILPEEVNNEITERLKEIEVHQEEEIIVNKTQAYNNLSKLRFI